MAGQLSIGAVSRATGLSVKAIRFYEDAGYVPPVRRSAAGYRTFSDIDVRRLRLVRQLRSLGVSWPQVRSVIEGAFTEDCAVFATELGEIFEQQRQEISRRIAGLETLRRDIEALAEHIQHCECEPGQSPADCAYCLILDTEGGDSNAD